LEFIYEKQLFPELEYIFKHILTQEVAYNSLLARRKKEIHENIGKAIEEIYVERLEEFYEMLAYHYSKSENFEKAYQYLKLSGIKATEKHSPQEAFHHYKEAINALKQMPESEDNKKAQIEICRLVYIPAIILGYPEGSMEIFQEGEKLSKEIRDNISLAHFYAHIGFYYFMIGDLLKAIECGENAVRAAENTDDIGLKAINTYDLCHFYHFVGEDYKILELLPPFIDLLEKTDKDLITFGRAAATYPISCALYGFSIGALGNFEQGEVICEKGLSFAREKGHLRTLGLTEIYYGILYMLKGDANLTIKHAQNCVKYCEEAKFIIVLGYAYTVLGAGYYFRGDQETARHHIEKGIKIQQDIGVLAQLSWHYLFLSMTLFDMGDQKKALDSIEQALKLSQKNNEKGVEGISRIWLGRILSKTDPSQRDKSEESILQGIQILEPLQIKPWYSEGYLALGELYTDMGQKDKALENLNKAKGMFKEMGMDYYLAKTQAVLSRL
jgi:tetratricopeptide (TPR) repeat protein